MKLKAIKLIDGYKVSHRVQYPEGTELVYSNFTPRSVHQTAQKSEYWDDKVVFFGLQGMAKWLLIDLFNETFFSRPKQEVVDDYARTMDKYLGEGSVTTHHIAALHDLGYLPIEIKALPEGSRVDVKVPMLTIRNTKPEFFWITNYLETLLSAELWKSVNNATIAFEYRRLFEAYAKMTGAPADSVLWQGHDFSMRGMSGVFDAAQSGAGHLISFLGSDTVPAIDYLEEYYGASNTFVAGSVPASEHSVMTMEGPTGERDLLRRLITEVHPEGIVSVVSDSFDFWSVITKYSAELKEEILNRKPNSLGLAKTVFRPDSGDPVKILTGYTVYRLLDDSGEVKSYNDLAGLGPVSSYDAVQVADGSIWEVDWAYSLHDSLVLSRELSDAEVKGAVECLWDIFGGTTTDKGYKVLHERVGLIYGDSITVQRAQQILSRLKDKGFASNNVVLGIGSYTYQYSTRDSLGMAVKATFGVVNGQPREIFKDPATGDGLKKSAKGLLRVEKEGGKYVLYDQQTPEQEAQGELKTVFKDGQLLIETNLDEIRSRINAELAEQSKAISE